MDSGEYTMSTSFNCAPPLRMCMHSSPELESNVARPEPFDGSSTSKASDVFPPASRSIAKVAVRYEIGTRTRVARSNNTVPVRVSGVDAGFYARARSAVDLAGHPHTAADWFDCAADLPR